MGLEDISRVDMMTRSLDGVPNGLDLIIVDAGSLADEERRYEMLLDKLAAYMDYILSDEFAREYPHTAAAQILIRVLCATPPTDAMQRMNAIYPSGDRTHRIRVVFEDVEVWMRRVGHK